jgi:hypothetical protein
MGSAVCESYDTRTPNLGDINIHAAADKRDGFETKVITSSGFFFIKTKYFSKHCVDVMYFLKMMLP